MQPVLVRLVKVHGRRQLRVSDAAGKLRFAVYSFGRGFRDCFTVQTRDVNGDGVLDVIVTARGPGSKHVLSRVFSGRDGSLLPPSLARPIPRGVRRPLRAPCSPRRDADGGSA